MNSKNLLLSGVALVSLFGAVNPVFAQGTAFVYQGRLNDGANPASGSYDLRFAICDAGSNGNVIGVPITNAPTGATNGLFIVALDFGSGVFTGPARWLEIGVRTNGSAGPYSTLLPRQPLAAAPYAITAANVAGLQIQPNAGSGAPNFIGGSVVNYIAPGIVGSVIDGGGATNFAGPGNTSSNSIAGNFGVVGGGQNNNIATGGDYNAIGGGVNNLIDNSAYSAVAGGKANTIQSGANYSAIGGGIGNVASGIGSFIGGGGYDGTTFAGNTNGGDASVINGGLKNTIETISLGSTIGGGYQNLIETHANGTTIGGGIGNIIEFHSAATTIAGGYENHVGTHVGSSAIGGGSIIPSTPRRPRLAVVSKTGLKQVRWNQPLGEALAT